MMFGFRREILEFRVEIVNTHAISTIWDPESNPDRYEIFEMDLSRLKYIIINAFIPDNCFEFLSIYYCVFCLFLFVCCI